MTKDEVSVRQKLENEPKVKIIVERNRYEDQISVTVNGYRYLIKRGMQVDVPEPVAKILEDSYNVTRLSEELSAPYKAPKGKQVN